MAKLAWMDGTLNEGNNAVGLDQVLKLAEEMFDSLADRLQRKVEEQRSDS